MAKVSVLIPSRNEQFLGRTVADLLVKAAGDIEVIVVVDEQWPAELVQDARVTYLHPERPQGMRAGINWAASRAIGKYLLKVDAHCLFDEGYDVKLAADMEDNWVVVPRRYRLIPETWTVEPVTPERMQIDYEHFIYPRRYRPLELHGFRWDERAIQRAEVLIDDNMTFQGSAWFMAKTWFERNRFEQIEGYNGLPQQEAEELGQTTWLNGGRVVVNKKTFYAHLHKGGAYGRGYPLGQRQFRECYAYSFNKWVVENRANFVRVVEKFWPLPGWPENWQEKVYG